MPQVAHASQQSRRAPWQPAMMRHDQAKGATMNPLCKDCEKGPFGISGHDGLFSQTMSSNEMHFQCRVCNATWTRKNLNGLYTWTRTESKVAGPSTPGRPGG
jgi:hypothetical protein